MTVMLRGSLIGIALCAFVVTVSGQSFINSIICPIPGNPSPATVTPDDCANYAACEFTDGLCHMKKNNESGYVVSSDPVDTERGFYVTLDKIDPANTLFGADVPQLILEVIQHENYHVQIKIYDAENSRYEVPIPLSLPEATDPDPMYEVNVGSNGSPLTLTVSRISNGNEVLRLAGPLTFEDQFIQVTHRLSSSYLYGIGEHPHTSLRHTFDPRQTYPIFARDQMVTPTNVNQYGSHPYYVNVEDDDGNTHSVLLYNSNAMEYSTFLMGDVPAVTIRTLGGILDFHVFMGPTPEDVNIQYANTVGLPIFPPYWAFGFMLSRWGYDSTDNYREIYDRMKAANIPWDVQVFDIDYMYRFRDFTYDMDRFGDLPEVIQELHDADMKVILILDPALVVDWDNYPPSERGRDQDVFIKWASPDLVPEDQAEGAGEYIVGYVWPDNKTVFPDFMNPDTITWWSNELQLLNEELAYDGIWIDMNEPANFGTNVDKPFNWPANQPDWSLKCPNNSIENPPYGSLVTFSDENVSKRLSDKTICMSTTQTDGTNTYSHYDVHNLYGISESIASYNAWNEDLLPGSRPFILSRSTFVGSGKYAIHWLGDNTANWQQLGMSIIGLIEFNMFGIPYVGADVCGFFDEPDEELCIRWMQLGAFYPFDRNHNTNGTDDQDPAKPGWDLAPVLSRDVLLLRYKYIPYMYARFHRAHMNGHSVIRSLFNVFPSDMTARDVDTQFMWSTDLMVAPVITQGAVSRDVYFPEGLWYDLVTGALEATGPITKNVEAPLEKIPAYIRGGSILPFQEPGLTTVESRQNPFGLTVALDEDRNAIGEIFWDDGFEEHVMSETYLGDIVFVENELSIIVNHDPTIADGLMLETIQFYGFPANLDAVSINGELADSSSWVFDETTNVLTLSLSVPINEALNILFNYQNP